MRGKARGRDERCHRPTVSDTLPGVKRFACALVFVGLAATASADDILAGGNYYYKAHLEDITADTVTIVHKGGRITVTWSSLSTEFQRKYAKQHEEAIRQQALDAQAKDDAAKLQAGGMRMLGGTIISILADGGVLLMPTGSPQAALLRGYDAKDLADGDPVPPMMVVADGTYSYDSQKGTRVTVHAFKVAPKAAN